MRLRPALGHPGLLLLAVAGVLAALFGARPLGAVLFERAPALLNGAQAAVQRYLAPWIWDVLLLPLVERPTWVVPLALGLLLLGLALRPRRRVAAVGPAR